jgi:hypothetical protein
MVKPGDKITIRNYHTKEKIIELTVKVVSEEADGTIKVSVEETLPLGGRGGPPAIAVDKNGNEYKASIVKDRSGEFWVILKRIK